MGIVPKWIWFLVLLGWVGSAVPDVSSTAPIGYFLGLAIAVGAYYKEK